MLNELKQTVQGWLDSVLQDKSEMYPPSDSRERKSEVADYVEALFKDSKSWREKSLQRRFINYEDPVDFWRKCRDLEQGNHWQVWGRRNQDAGNEWRHELQDNFIGNQTRVRKSFLTANWHDITVLPNLLNVNEVIQQERDQTAWYQNTVLGTHRMLNEGTQILKTVFDRSEDPRGLVDEVLCDNESIFPSPYATGFKKRENCWYVIHATMKNIQSIAERYPDLDINKVTRIADDRAKDITMLREETPIASFSKTKFADHFDVYLDDPTLTKADFDPQELEMELEKIQAGQKVEPKRGQNHPAFIEGYLNTINQLDSGKDVGTPEDQKFTQDIIEELVNLIGDRKKMAQDDEELDGIKPGKKQKYPFGRHIIVIGGQVALDEPWEDFDWRRLFHKANCESLPGHFWGRGIAEILWYTNLAADTALSRTADLTITVGMPKAYFAIEDKETITDKANPWSNDPTKPGFFTARPPVFPKGVLPPELLNLYEIYKSKATQEIGVNEVTMGQAPSKRASGKMVEQLIQQNTILVTGEASSNQNYMLEEVVETRIEMYKVLYTEPRWYIVNGQEVAVNLSRELKKLHTFQVRVKPNSNFPNQWEQEIQQVMQWAAAPMADGLPLLPREAALDLIAQRFPQYGPSGKYYQMSQALQLGLAELKKQQEQQNQDANTEEQIRQKIRGVGINQIAEHIGGGNGKGI